jgi:hypothetical protein
VIRPELALAVPTTVVARTIASVAAIENRRLPVFPLREAILLSVHRSRNLNGEGVDKERWFPRDIVLTSETFREMSADEWDDQESDNPDDGLIVPCESNIRQYLWQNP